MKHLGSDGDLELLLAEHNVTPLEVLRVLVAAGVASPTMLRLLLAQGQPG